MNDTFLERPDGLVKLLVWMEEHDATLRVSRQKLAYEYNLTLQHGEHLLSISKALPFRELNVSRTCVCIHYLSLMVAEMERMLESLL